MDLSPTICVDDNDHPKNQRLFVKDGTVRYFACQECGYSWKMEGNTVVEELLQQRLKRGYKDVSPRVKQKKTTFHVHKKVKLPKNKNR